MRQGDQLDSGTSRFDSNILHASNIYMDFPHELLRFKSCFQGITTPHMSMLRIADLFHWLYIMLQDKIGSFEVGKEFDALLVDCTGGETFDLFPDDGPRNAFEK